MTVLFVTHDLGEAIALADAVVVFTSRPGQDPRAADDRSRPAARRQKIRFSPEFARHHEELWNELKDEVVRGTETR